MNKGIISVYRRGNNVVVFPRWVKDGGYGFHSNIFKYEVDTIYRLSKTDKVRSTKLPLALY